MAAPKAVKAVYFCKDFWPTDAEKAEAQTLGITAFRNAALVDDDSPIEKVEVVAGAVPPQYRKIPGVKVRELKKAPAPSEK